VVPFRWIVSQIGREAERKDRGRSQQRLNFFVSACNGTSVANLEMTSYITTGNVHYRSFCRTLVKALLKSFLVLFFNDIGLQNRSIFFR
jgi:hypothetical protein